MVILCSPRARYAYKKLGVVEERVFKTLVISLDRKALAVGVIPVSSKLNMKLIAHIIRYSGCTC